MPRPILWTEKSRSFVSSDDHTTSPANSPVPERSTSVFCVLGRALSKITSCCPVSVVRMKATRDPSRVVAAVYCEGNRASAVASASVRSTASPAPRVVCVGELSSCRNDDVGASGRRVPQLRDHERPGHIHVRFNRTQNLAADDFFGRSCNVRLRREKGERAERAD